MSRPDRRPLPESLESLGIEELKERLEVSPLLGAGEVHGQDIETCCSCKMPPPRPDAPDDDGGGGG